MVETESLRSATATKVLRRHRMVENLLEPVTHIGTHATKSTYGGIPPTAAHSLGEAMRSIGRVLVVGLCAGALSLGGAGLASAAPADRDAVATTVCRAQKTAELLRAIDRKTWISRAARETAVRAAFADAKSACTPKPYPVRVEARQGRDPVSGTLRISCRQGYELSPVNPPGKYWISFGALSPESLSSVTRTARTTSSYEVDYTILPQTPPGGGLYLEGTCVPTA